MCEELVLERVDNSSWGFRLTGGLDFGTPLTVIKVTGGSIAELSGVVVGDLIIEINGRPAKNLTHTDAQNCILESVNRLTLAVMRGSELTPPTQTPLRGMTPMIDSQGLENGVCFEDQKVELTGKLENLYDEGYKCISDSPFRTIEEGDVSLIEHESLEQEKGKEVSDLELDELLTGNEEVLDEGVLGINFQKFHPQVDFIRESEVFKALQTENVYKEIPEEVQLEIEPTKRFSTFLMKPKPPPSPKPTGPFWHYPKAPKYLPKEEDEHKEEPKRRIVKEKGHSVLWLFLGETGEDIVDERWGTDEEERINLSRNENREEDEWAHSKDRPSSAGKEAIDEKKQLETVAKGQEEKEPESCNDQPANIEKCETENKEQTCETSGKEEVNEPIESFKSDAIENVNETKNEGEEQDSVKPSVDDSKCNIDRDLFEKELSEIQAQIALLEERAPGDLQTQLVQIHQQLAKIVEMQTAITSTITKEEDREYLQTSCRDDSEPSSVGEEKCEEEEEPQRNGCEGDDLADVELDSEEIVQNGISDTDMEKGEDKEVLEIYKAGEYELCEAPESIPRKQKKKPLTPLPRPIVLPGGKMWRQPKDAALEEFYQGILIEQADVLVGTTVGVNFRKYVPPKFDVENSAVCRLIREIEDKTLKGKISPEIEYFQTPIDKRHFYAATLPEPEPIGNVELREMQVDL